MTDNLYHLLIDTGLVQFGLFGKSEAPYVVHTQLLPSYPDVLEAITEQAASYLSPDVEHLLCLPESLPFGVALSLRTQLPLVYSLGTDASGVHDLIGAYDVGHSACLLLNTWEDERDILPLIEKARRVGLEVKTILTLFSMDALQQNSVVVTSVINLNTMIQSLIHDGLLSPQIAQSITKNG